LSRNVNAENFRLQAADRSIGEKKKAVEVKSSKGNLRLLSPPQIFRRVDVNMKKRHCDPALKIHDKKKNLSQKVEKS